MAVATGDGVKVHKHVIEITGSGMDIYVVDIALCAVEENAAHVIQRFFQSPAQEARPVRRDQLTANGVGVVAEIDQHKAVGSLTVEAQHVDALVHFANGRNNIRVVDAGIGFNAAVFHPETADKGNVRREADTVAHSSRFAVGQRIARGVCRTAQDEFIIFTLERIGRISDEARAGVRMRRMQVNGFDRKTGFLCDVGPDGICLRRVDAAVIHAQKHQTRLAACEGQSTQFQLVTHTLYKPGLIVSGDADTHHGCNVDTCKTCLQSVHAVGILSELTI